MLKNIALILGSLLAAFFAAELGLRIAGISYPAFYREDKDLGGALRPGAEGWFRSEGRSYVRVNSDGMRDREHAITKPPGVLRIAVLGDSFAEAMPVPEDQAFWAVMERRLERCSRQKTEVLNFGVSGYGTGQELLMLRTRVWKYQPDIVLLAFFTGNDVRNNSRALNQDPAVPYFVYKGDRLVLDDSFRENLRSSKLSPRALAASDFGASVRNHLRVLQVMSEARVALKRRMTVHAAEKKDDMASAEHDAAGGGELGLDNAVYSEPGNDRWREAWRVTEGLITTMRDEVRAHGAQLWVATLSTGIQVYPDAAVRSAFMKRIGVSTLFYPDERIRSFCKNAGIPVVTLAPEMASYAESRHVYLHGFKNAALGFGHWNEEGNRVAGRLLAAALCGGIR